VSQIQKTAMNFKVENSDIKDLFQ